MPSSAYHHTLGGHRWPFADLRDVLAKASPARSGAALAGIAAQSSVERMAARLCLADVPLRRFLGDAVYLTWHPQVGRHEAQRNCISNVRPEGLPVQAAARPWWLCQEARRLGLKGFGLKDRSDAAAVAAG